MILLSWLSVFPAISLLSYNDVLFCIFYSLIVKLRDCSALPVLSSGTNEDLATVFLLNEYLFLNFYSDVPRCDLVVPLVAS